jgi:hypothetical protein
MICLNPILKSPLLASLVAGCCVMLYFTLMSYSPNLPPAAICSIAAGYFVYFMMGGKILCDEQTPALPENPVPAPESSVPEAIATMAVANTMTNPVGKPVSAYKIF